MMKRGYKEVDTQVAELFYTNAISFECIRNPALAKMCDMMVNLELATNHHLIMILERSS